MDLDIEMDVDGDIVPYDAPTTQIPEAYTQDIITGEEQEPGEVHEIEVDNDNAPASAEEKTVVPNKLHIRGLDTFTPEDVKSFVSAHYGTDTFVKIEWIDDSSANIVFRTDSTTQEALVALAAVPIADPTQLPPLEAIPAKGFEAKPDSILSIRFAVQSDRKVVGAAARSRFYLLHPEYDPEERRRRGEFHSKDRRYRDREDRRGGRDRDGRERRGGRRYDDRYRRDDSRGRRSSPEEEPFDVNLYGDDPDTVAKRATIRRPRRRNSEGSIDSTGEYTRKNSEKELFPDRRSRNGGVSRDRSRSPIRDRDGDAEMDLDEEARNGAALRHREKGRSRSLKERISKPDNKDLFPTKGESKSKELFPTKVSSGTGGRAKMDQVDDNTVLASAKLAERITAPRTASDSSAFNIRGAANKRGSDQGIAIKGTAATVKELFPDKFGENTGKELFVEKLEGRGHRRQKAEDLFY
ncbi:hypothetical protein QBC46DRAFT_26434 [Diplogelasinospora grovesii]|uniref:Uncharacterized protein n=1 Tax=Diplogelasinospora grovesii TaxID=303347 RepID=A0AAN6MZS2_9PEZI|nr:hypothetical protein QBC46DRAFT_26434 [Diplogelasinospora grovesii]